MSRRMIYGVVAGGIAVTMAAACSPVVWMGPYRSGGFAPLRDSAEVHLIDGRGMDRAELESVLDEHYLLARVHRQLPYRGDREEAVQKEIEKALPLIRRSGGDTALYLEDSAVMGVIFQNARYAGPPEALVIYIMRRK